MGETNYMLLSDNELASTASYRKSLEAIRMGKAGLSKARKQMLSTVPNSGDSHIFGYESISIRDIAYLSAATLDEFALLRGKDADILFHGDGGKCRLDDELIELLKSKKYRLLAHTHPDFGRIIASKEDRAFLRYIGQERSIIISYITGEEFEFGQSEF